MSNFSLFRFCLLLAMSIMVSGHVAGEMMGGPALIKARRAEITLAASAPAIVITSVDSVGSTLTKVSVAFTAERQGNIPLNKSKFYTLTAYLVGSSTPVASVDGTVSPLVLEGLQGATNKYVFVISYSQDAILAPSPPSSPWPPAPIRRGLGMNGLQNSGQGANILALNLLVPSKPYADIFRVNLVFENLGSGGTGPTQTIFDGDFNWSTLRMEIERVMNPDWIVVVADQYLIGFPQVADFVVGNHYRGTFSTYFTANEPQSLVRTFTARYNGGQFSFAWTTLQFN